MVNVSKVSGQLQREERIATCRLEDPAHQRPRRVKVESFCKEQTHGPQAEPAHIDPLRSIGIEPDCPFARSLRQEARSFREEEGYGFIFESPLREPQRSCRRRVEPLDVVDRDHYRFTRRELAQHAQEARGDRARLRWSIGRLRPEKRNLQRAALGSGQRRDHVAVDALEKIAQRGEGELSFQLARPRHKHGRSPLARGVDAGLPQRRLSDTRTARENEGANGRRFRVQKPVEPRELLLAPY